MEGVPLHFMVIFTFGLIGGGLIGWMIRDVVTEYKPEMWRILVVAVGSLLVIIALAMAKHAQPLNWPVYLFRTPMLCWAAVSLTACILEVCGVKVLRRWS